MQNGDINLIESFMFVQVPNTYQHSSFCQLTLLYNVDLKSKNMKEHCLDSFNLANLNTFEDSLNCYK